MTRAAHMRVPFHFHWAAEDTIRIGSARDPHITGADILPDRSYGCFGEFRVQRGREATHKSKRVLMFEVRNSVECHALGPLARRIWARSERDRVSASLTGMEDSAKCCQLYFIGRGSNSKEAALDERPDDMNERAAMKAQGLLGLLNASCRSAGHLDTELLNPRGGLCFGFLNSPNIDIVSNRADPDDPPSSTPHSHLDLRAIRHSRRKALAAGKISVASTYLPCSSCDWGTVTIDADARIPARLDEWSLRPRRFADVNRGGGGIGSERSEAAEAFLPLDGHGARAGTEPPGMVIGRAEESGTE
ncbi:hypothetical protein B0H17DRAFT_1284259 [Mycena rosella]|uniref:Uncharacterized protein n=1 Tax=Mycena rosella TaxID=1033263 RepID=A0AAD7BSZ0_MYCRO|nr:hypothetical protein B0H17DRAFT_1284259 [Mycena rosella]